MKAWRTLVFLWRWAARVVAPGPVVTFDDPPWRPSDAANLSAFLATETGRLLTTKLQHAEQVENLHHVLRRGNAERVYDTGYAAGFRGMAAWLMQLSARSSPQEDHTASDPSPDAGALRDRNSP